jgi:signal transduction histidine kinase
VQRIAERLDGDVGAENLPGEGGLFWFTLPAAPTQVSDSAPRSSGTFSTLR